MIYHCCVVIPELRTKCGTKKQEPHTVTDPRKPEFAAKTLNNLHEKKSSGERCEQLSSCFATLSQHNL